MDNPLIKQLKAFLASPYDRIWLKSTKISVYVRKAHHLIGRDILSCLDLATFDVPERHQSKGLSKNFISAALELCPFEGVYIENVNEPRFAAFFEKDPQWTPCGPYQDLCPCFFRKVVRDEGAAPSASTVSM